MPSTESELKELQNGFQNRWNFPGCYGAIDGKHITIRAPNNCGSTFFNYKKLNSIVLLALVGPDYQFTYINVGSNGTVSDGGIFRKCSLFTALENGLLPDNGVIVGDDAFPLKTYLMKPYSGNNLSYDQKIFNYRLSRSRRISENAFGILVSRFRIFERPIACKVETVDKIVRAACVLHNWLSTNYKAAYMPRGSVDSEDIDICEIVPGSWRSEIVQLPRIERVGSNNHSREAKIVREAYTKYFTNEGRVLWQDRMIH